MCNPTGLIDESDHWCYNTIAIRQILRIPEDIFALNLISIGHPAEEKEPRTQYDEQRIHHERW